MELKTYLDILARRWRIVLVVTLVVVSLAALGSQFISPKYQAEALLRVVTPLGGSSGDINYQTNFATRLVNTYAQIATSERVNSELKQKLGLQNLPTISVNVIDNSEIIQIAVESESPALAAETANALTEILISYQDNSVKPSDQNPLNILTARKEEIQAELTQYQQQHDQLVQTYSQTSTDMAILDRTIQLKEASYRNLQDQYEQTIISEAVFTNLTIRATKAALAAEIEGVRKELDALNQQYKDLSTQSNEYLQRIALLRQTIQSTQNAYSALLSQYDSVSLANSRQENAQNIEIASAATEPSSASGPSRLFILGLGVICGLTAGVVSAFLAENLDPRVFSTEQVELVTSTPVIGSVSKFNKRKSRDDNNDPTIQRDYWFLRTKLQALIHAKSIKTIMVTSPNRAEGKSTIVFGLASALAQNKLKVLVVDADLRKPQQHMLFGVTVEKGLGDFLGGDVDSLKGIILKNAKPGLDLLPNLTESDNPIELLQSPHLKNLIEATKVYDVVLFDTPAYLAFPDALDLGKVVDYMIIVIQQGHTTSSDIKSICQYLESVNSDKLGIVVNQIPRTRKNIF